MNLKKMSFSLSAFVSLSLLAACGQKEKSQDSDLSSERSCNESAWISCITELSMMDKENDFGQYLRKEMECKRICNR